MLFHGRYQAPICFFLLLHWLTKPKFAANGFSLDRRQQVPRSRSCHADNVVGEDTKRTSLFSLQSACNREFQKSRAYNSRRKNPNNYRQSKIAPHLLRLKTNRGRQLVSLLSIYMYLFLLMFNIFGLLFATSRPAEAAIIPRTNNLSYYEEVTTDRSGSVLSSTTNVLSKKEWILGNGNVQLPDPLFIGNLRLTDPVLLGSGGGGAVFAMSSDNNGKENDGKDNQVAVKVSWESSSTSVRKECRILQVLEEKLVSGVEKCYGSVPYHSTTTEGDGTASSGRVIIAMRPVIQGEVVNSISELPAADTKDDDLRAQAVQQVVQTLLQMLAANIVTTDVQPLISKRTGQVLFIDMTEAQQLSSPPTFLELALAGSFISEMTALIPEDSRYQTVAAQTLETELRNLMIRGNNHDGAHAIRLQDGVCKLLLDQVPSLFTSESLRLLESPSDNMHSIT
jgi:hypothetical protein